MGEQLFEDPVQETWKRLKKKSACTRDPNAGPGTCYYWWEGCPDAEKRGCYQKWWREVNFGAVK